jgi:hypothetical protein
MIPRREKRIYPRPNSLLFESHFPRSPSAAASSFSSHSSLRALCLLRSWRIHNFCLFHNAVVIMTQCCASLFATRQLDFQQKELHESWKWWVHTRSYTGNFFASIKVPSGNHDGGDERVYTTGFVLVWSLQNFTQRARRSLANYTWRKDAFWVWYTPC